MDYYWKRYDLIKNIIKLIIFFEKIIKNNN